MLEKRATTRGFKFDLQRAIQATGVVLRDRGSMDRMRLLKILYLASRKALEETGKPIIGGRASALENGPLHSEVYDQIKGDANDTEWRNYFHNSGYTMSLKADPGRLDLSPYEIDILNEKAQWAEQFETFELSEWTHSLPEWKANQPAKKGSNPICVEDILSALGMSDDEMQEIINEQRADDQFSAALEAVR